MKNRLSHQCVDVKDKNYVNNDPIIDYRCTGGTNQKWVYTAEGQLRPEGKNKFCMDIDGGKPIAGKQVHLYDCDGGSSEKWSITEGGEFRQGDVCLDLSYATAGNEYIVYHCGGNAAHQTFTLDKVADWLPTDY